MQKKKQKNLGQLVGRIGFISMAFTWWIATGAAVASEIFQEAPTSEVVADSYESVP